MKRILSLGLLAALLAGPSFAQDKASPWSSAQFTVPHKERGEAVVKIAGTDALTDISIQIGEESFSVPAAEMSDIELPKLDTANLLFGADWYGPIKPDEEKTPHLIVEIEFSEAGKFGTFPKVKFLFYDGKFQERILIEQTTPSVWVEYRKRPGEAERETGTITRSPPSPDGPPTEE